MKFKILFFLVFIFVSCTSDDQQEAMNEDNLLLKKMIVTSSDNSVLTYNYEYDGRKIVKISLSDGSSTRYYYQGNLITKVVEYNSTNSNPSSELVNEYDSNERIVRTYYTDFLNNISSETEYSYDQDLIINYTSNQTNNTNQSIDFYSGFLYKNAQGEIIQHERYFEGNLFYILYFSHDSKNSTFKNIIGFNKLLNSIEMGKYNNVLGRYDDSMQDDFLEVYTFDYEYNEFNFPVSAVKTHYFSTISTIEYFYN